MYGSSEASLKGNSMKRKSKLPRLDAALERPKKINHKFKSILLSIDVMNVNQIPFLVSKSYHRNHYQICALDNLKADCVSRALESNVP